MNINWYPGHIAKAEKALKANINLTDVIIEVVDARIPFSSLYPDVKRLTGEKPRLILLNKSDLSDTTKNDKNAAEIEKLTGCKVLKTVASSNKDINKITNKLTELAKPAIEKLTAKGLLPRPARAMVIGMPNVGKSSIINKLIGKGKTKTGAKAGVTRQQQWVRINPKLDFLDTPGIIPVKQVSQAVAIRLAFVNSIGENAYENEFVAREFLKIVRGLYPGLIEEKFGFEDGEQITLESVAVKLNRVVKNGEPDIKVAAQNILHEFRNGKFGRLTLD